MWLSFLSRIFLISLDHDLMASIWEKAISILAGNLNSSRSYLITAVLSEQPILVAHHSLFQPISACLR